MNPKQYHTAMTVTLIACAAVGGALLYAWIHRVSPLDIQISLPGQDGRPPEGLHALEQVDLRGEFQVGDGQPSELPGYWPRFRGPDYDNIAKNTPPLADHWGPDGPRVLWSRDLGEGHAAPIVRNGRVYLLDYDEVKRADTIRCFSLDDGKDIWHRAYQVTIRRNHGISRTVPAVSQDLLVTIGPRCHVVCLHPDTGEFRWGIDLQREYGTEEPLWYTGQCPLIDGSMVVLAPGGPDALLMGVDGTTGVVQWKTPNPRGWKMSHASVIPMTLAGIRTYVYSALGGVVGVSAEPDSLGQVLWEVPWKARVIAPSPVAVGDNRVLIAAGYGEGSMMLEITAADGKVVADIVYVRSPRDAITSEQQTPIYYNGLLYSVMPKDAGALREQFVCYHPDGRLLWSSGPENRFGLGPFLLADGKFFLLSGDGLLTMVKADAEAYVPLDQAQVLDGPDAWGPIALAGTRMLLRDSLRMICIDVGVNTTESSP